MENELINEIEDSLEMFARNPDPLFELSEKLEDENSELNLKDLDALNVCVNFTVGILAGYIQQIQAIN